MAEDGDSGSARKTGTKSDIVELGSGAFTTEEERTTRARYHFLQSIRNRCPKPLFALRDVIFPRYRDWVNDVLDSAAKRAAWNRSPEAAEARDGWEEVFRGLGLPERVAKLAAEERPPRGTGPDDPIFTAFMLWQYEVPSLERLLMEWAQLFGLTHAREFEESDATKPSECPEEFELVETALHEQYWVCQWAVDTLWQWRFLEAGTEMMNNNPPHWARGQFVSGVEGRLPKMPPIIVSKDGWEMQAEQRNDFRKRIHNAVDSFLDRYIQDAEQKAESFGLIPTIRKKREHFDWLAVFQVTGCTHQEIAAGCGVEAQTVADGIKSSAALIGLERRRGSRGPEPDKTQDSST